MIPMDCVAQKELAKYSPQETGVAAIILNNKKRSGVHAEDHINGGIMATTPLTIPPGIWVGHMKATFISAAGSHSNKRKVPVSAEPEPEARQRVRLSDFMPNGPYPAHSNAEPVRGAQRSQ